MLALRIVNFNWADNFHPAGGASQTKKRIGYVAQEVEMIFPSLVTESAMRVEFGPDGSELPTPPELMKKSVRTGAIGSPILVKAFQEYVAQTDPRIEALEAWRPGVQTVLDDHESRLDVLEAA